MSVDPAKPVSSFLQALCFAIVSAIALPFILLWMLSVPLPGTRTIDPELLVSPTNMNFQTWSHAFELYGTEVLRSYAAVLGYSLVTVVCAFVVAIPLGILWSRNRNRPLRHVLFSVYILMRSIPVFALLMPLFLWRWRYAISPDFNWSTADWRVLLPIFIVMAGLYPMGLLMGIAEAATEKLRFQYYSGGESRPTSRAVAARKYLYAIFNICWRERRKIVVTFAGAILLADFILFGDGIVAWICGSHALIEQGGSFWQVPAEQSIAAYQLMFMLISLSWLLFQLVGNLLEKWFREQRLAAESASGN